MEIQAGFKIVDVSPKNIDETGPYCIKNKKAPGYQKKVEWFKNKINNGLKIKIIKGPDGKQNGFIEYLPSELAWRPVKAKNYIFIHCIALFGKDLRNRGLASLLIESCERDAMAESKSGICTMCSDGPWIATKELFIKNNFQIIEKLGRFELLYKKYSDKDPLPQFVDWTLNQKKYSGWNLVYSDQCPWHEKSVLELRSAAEQNGIDLKVKRITSPEEAKYAPSGFGTFTLIKDGNVLADHYISATRFKNIIKQN